MATYEVNAQTTSAAVKTQLIAAGLELWDTVGNTHYCGTMHQDGDAMQRVYLTCCTLGANAVKFVYHPN